MSNSATQINLIKQIDSSVKTGGNITTVSTTWTPIFTTNVTPKSSSSKFLIMACVASGITSDTANTGSLGLFRNGSLLQSPTSPGSRIPGHAGIKASSMLNYVDAPSTTSNTIYTIAIYSAGGAYSTIEDSNNQFIVWEI